MSIEEYREEYLEFMKQWAKELREWTNSDGFFYLDGIFDPETWFAKENDFRPLFILKEAHEQKCEEAEAEAKKFIEIEKCVNFVGTGDCGSDPWKGKRMWKRVGKLAAAMFRMRMGEEDIPDYDSVINDANATQEDIETEHQKICRKIAFINLKKLAGGSLANSEKSKSTLCFECHAQHFHEKLMNQIRMIRPNVIICCGKDTVIECLGIKKDDTYLEIIENGITHKIPVVNGYHPQQTSNENFYSSTLTKMKAMGVFSKSVE